MEGWAGPSQESAACRRRRRCLPTPALHFLDGELPAPFVVAGADEAVAAATLLPGRCATARAGDELPHAIALDSVRAPRGVALPVRPRFAFLAPLVESLGREVNP